MCTPPEVSTLRIEKHWGELNLGKVIKIIVDTSCQIWRLEYTKFDFGWGSAPLKGRYRRGNGGLGKGRRREKGKELDPWREGKERGKGGKERGHSLIFTWIDATGHNYHLGALFLNNNWHYQMQMSPRDVRLISTCTNLHYIGLLTWRLANTAANSAFNHGSVSLINYHSADCMYTSTVKLRVDCRSPQRASIPHNTVQ